MAGARIGALRVDLGINSAQFSAGLKAAQTQLGLFGRAGSAAMAGFKSAIIPAVAGLLSFSAAVNGTRSALAAFSKVADAAAKTGFDAEFLQSIAYQASLAGVSFDQMTSALTTFARGSGQAEEKTGRMYAALKKLDPTLLASIRDAGTMEERFRLVIDALDKIEDPARRAAVAVAAFGNAGASVAAAFDGGSAALDQMMQKARNLGLIVDRDLIAKADQLGDEWDTTAQVLDIKMKKALVNLGPIMVGLTGLAADFAGFIGQAVDGMNSIDARATATLESEWEALEGAKRAGFGGQDVDLFGMKLNFGSDQQAKQDEILAELRRRAIQNLRTQLQSIPSSGDDDGGTDLATKAKEEIDPFAARIAELSDVLTQTHDPFEQMKLDLTDLKTMFDENRITAERYGMAVEKVQWNAAKATVDSLGDITGALAGAFEDNKAFAAANIVVSTAAGAMKAFEQGGLLGWAGAAAIVAAGAMQLNQVLTAQPGSASVAGQAVTDANDAQQSSATAVTHLDVRVLGKGSVADAGRGVLDQIQQEARRMGKRLALVDL